MCLFQQHFHHFELVQVCVCAPKVELISINSWGFLAFFDFLEKLKTWCLICKKKNQSHISIVPDFFLLRRLPSTSLFKGKVTVFTLLSRNPGGAKMPKDAFTLYGSLHPVSLFSDTNGLIVLPLIFFKEFSRRKLCKNCWVYSLWRNPGSPK